ncbi:alpha/beta hydrolase [Pseudoclavibacter chungangensis]|uniref:Alpha/beta hydrolase n=1 Tax=Pseudoclavibacter chungangensis TaxID=587635 RepID=A0A7J5C2D6_9MICO|nr:alpha/beta hydrolase [Pseudoclavibacter chungangensis]KAB1662340.1 alpha/beta hydrolase [Pseudoclavibacter chungangensis]NYJ65550.1 pimeloyl-ACP methyl ester carboxylesterase [Pseudoclavibacter chungangensis]
MHVLLVPGFWLQGDSWREVVPVLERAGHTVEAVTPLGLVSRNTDRASIGLADQAAALVARLDELAAGGADSGNARAAPVVLVGHSGGGALVQLAADARPARVARVVYVDAGPLPDGECVNDRLPVVDGEVPLPEWSFFDESELAGLDEATLERFRAGAVPEPVGVTRDPVRLHDRRRLDVPTTIIASTMTAAQLAQWIDAEVPFASELARLRALDIVDLPTGHWPQFSRPEALGQAIVDAIAEPDEP